MSEAGTPYPVSVTVEYPDRELDRLSTLFRVVFAAPIIALLAMVIGLDHGGDVAGGWRIHIVMGGFLIVPTMLMIVFRRKYPKWWFDYNVNLTSFVARVLAYMLLLRDEYPSTDEEQAVRVRIPYPDARNGLDRLLPLVKWILVLPHVIALWLLSVLAFLAAVIAWFAILVNGGYPKDLFEFQVGVIRWGIRVASYALLMVTDEYPPFRLGE